MEDYIENNQLSLNTQIANMNMELNYLLEKFSEFTKVSHFLDQNMHTNLEKVLDSVEQFLDNKPYLISNDNDATNNEFNFSCNTIEKRLFCNICQEYLIDSAKKLQKHLMSSKHSDGLKILRTGDKLEIKKLISNRKIESLIDTKTLQKIVKRTEKKIKKKQNTQQNLPKDAKNFLLSDLYAYSEGKSAIAQKLVTEPALLAISNMIKSSLSSRFPRALYYFHGSRISQLADDNSNINLFVDIGSLFFVYKPKPDVMLKIISDASSVLQLNNKWSNISINTAKDPSVLTAFNKKLNISFHLTFDNGLDYCKSGLIKELFTKQPICQKLCSIVKKWIKQSTLEAHFPVYIITMLVIFYCQIKRLLPPIHLLQSTCQAIMIGPWQINYDTKPFSAYGIETLPKTEEHIHYHLQGFFEYYADFNYKNYVICPYLAHIIGREHFTTMQSLPRYQVFISREPNSSAFKLNLNTPIIIQDPIEQNCNITSAISKGCLNLFQSYCYSSAQILKNKLIKKYCF